MTRALPGPRPREREAARRAPSSAGSGPGAGTRRDVAAFLERYADALLRGDLEAIAACHVTPVLFVTEWDSTVLATSRQVVEGFRGVVEEHRRRGYVALSHRVETVSTAASRLVEVAVRWTFHDADGRAVLHDRYRYLLRRVDDRGLLINAVVVLGGSTAAIR
ncbi:hypothetical protein GCM10023200_23910 [Actinomycetospora chlora]|uniref:SnoaL-like domain-containing protein n=1 Tax=Actinomycetospora chlora TaxID=663608 RepID=A0ABP9B333_9PSEU